MENIDKPTVQILGSLLHAYGVRHVVVSSGSRCAPLTVCFNRLGFFRLHTVIDERTAGFVGLGMAVALNEPVALVCTSGSAPLNYGPALAEAYYRRVPLIAISADRPANWIDQREGQTIHQAHCLDSVVRCSIDLQPCSASVLQWNEANLKINRALAEATGLIKGPVHINVQLEAPLTPMTEADYSYMAKKITVRERISASVHDILDLHSEPASRPMLIIGGIALSDKDRRRIEEFNRSSNVVVVAEAQSNIRGALRPAYFDKGLDLPQDMTPDLVMLIGGDMVSNRFKAWLRSLERTTFISTTLEDTLTDTYGHLKANVPCRVKVLIEYLEQVAKEASVMFKANWLRMHRKENTENGLVQMLQKLVSQFRFGDLHVSNGSAIRLVQYLDIPKGVRVECNRGVSGIEGSTSTAIGSAMVSERPTLLITGDMSAAYDIGALAINGIPANFKMVVLDNDGGDIFRNISTTSALPELEEYFAMPPRFPIKELAMAYGFDYCTEISAFMAAAKPAILHIKINPQQSKGLI